MAVVLSAPSTLGYLLRLVVNEEGVVVLWVPMCLQDQSFNGRENDDSSSQAGHFTQIVRVATKNSLPRHA